MIQVEFLSDFRREFWHKHAWKSMGFVTETEVQNPLSFILPALLTLRKLLNHVCACFINTKMGVIVSLLKV